MIGSGQFARDAHALVDQAAAGAFDRTPRSEIEAELQRFGKEIASRELAVARREQASRADAEREALEALDRKVEAL